MIVMIHFNKNKFFYSNGEKKVYWMLFCVLISKNAIFVWSWCLYGVFVPKKNKH